MRMSSKNEQSVTLHEKKEIRKRDYQAKTKEQRIIPSKINNSDL